MNLTAFHMPAQELAQMIAGG